MTGNFEGRKLIVVGGSSGMGKATAASVIAGGGSTVIIGRDQGRVDETVAELGKQGKAWGITADLADRARSTPSSGSWPRRTRTHHSW
jgi:NAD(P)-dependent dehydrogenase (short-subunit alcohol dehydrogenase family)